MTATTAPNVQAWLAKEAMPLGPFVVRIDGERSGSAIAPGHWVVVVDATGRLSRVGRILRIRTSLEEATLYFDKLHSGRDEEVIRAYIRNQEAEDQRLGQLQLLR